MTTEARRNALYSRLQEVLGDEPAATLMTMLPGAEPATKTDLAEAKTELKADIADVRAELKADIAEVRAEVAGVRSELLDIRSEIRQLHSNVQANVRTFVVTQTSTVIAVAGMVLAFDRLL